MNEVLDGLMTGIDGMGLWKYAIEVIIALNVVQAIMESKKNEIDFDLALVGKAIFYGLFSVLIYLVMGLNDAEKQISQVGFFNYFAFLFSTIEAVDNLCKFVLNPIVKMGALKINIWH